MSLTMPDVRYQAGEKLDGFAVTRVTELPNQYAVAYELEHQASGARVIHIHADDAENLFSVAFRTPTDDDTGLPHILEHSVLCGSKKFPVKHPFVEMTKQSMATFINAMTAIDLTLYPVASNVKKDLFNLADVYWDAVFHPRLEEDTFKQEGHHLEFAEKGNLDSDLIVKGIVYNEMKGAWSTPERLFSRYIQEQILEDTNYGRSSGGNPEAMTDLTYAKFKAFYERLYTPENAFIFLYGDTPTQEYLDFLSPRLKAYARKNLEVDLQSQPRWSQPREIERTYPLGKEEKTEGKTFLRLAWLVGDANDIHEALTFGVLNELLLGNDAAPLKKALIDSKLGEDLSGSGYSGWGLDAGFYIGLRGSEADRKDAFVKLVFDTLKDVAAKGFAQEKIDAAFHQFAYSTLEISSNYPLMTGYRTYFAWIHGADPLNYLRAADYLEEVKQRIAADPGIFGKLINERLLNNPHRLTAVLAPDPEMEAREDAAFAEKMKALKATLSKEDLERVAAEAAALEQRQSAPNSQEALETLPRLQVKDLPKKPKHIPTTVETLDGGVKMLRNDVFANGVNYLRLGFDLHGLGGEKADAHGAPLPELYLPLFSLCVNKMGAAGHDYVKMAERVSACTGSIGFGAGAGGHVVDPDQVVLQGSFTLKTLDDKVDEALGVLRDLLFELDFRDTARLKDVLVQRKARYRSQIAGAGRDYAIQRAAAGINPLGQWNEWLGGVAQPRLIQDLADNFDARKDEVIANLEAIRDALLHPSRMIASFTGSPAVYDTVAKTLSTWAGEMKGPAPGAPRAVKVPAAEGQTREGLAASMQVAYCAQVLPAPHLGAPQTAALSVARLLLSRGYMWEEIRIKGGAYGAGVSWSGLEQGFTFWSYRDPWIHKTLDVYKGLVEHVKAAEWTQADIDRAIIGTAKEGERPIRPAAATGTALWRHTHGDTNELREARHAAVLQVTPQAVKEAVLDVLEKGWPNSRVCVTSSRAKLEKANEERPAEALTIEEILP